MTKSKAAAAAPAEQRFRMLRTLHFESHGAERIAEAGTIVTAGDLPKHGTGRCDPNCNRPGGHDWFLTGGDPVLEVVVDDAAGAVSLAGQAPAEE